MVHVPGVPGVVAAASQAFIAGPIPFIGVEQSSG